MFSWAKTHKLWTSVATLAVAGAVTAILAFTGGVPGATQTGDPAACQKALYEEMKADYNRPTETPATKPVQCQGLSQEQLSDLLMQAANQYMADVNSGN